MVSNCKRGSIANATVNTIIRALPRVPTHFKSPLRQERSADSQQVSWEERESKEEKKTGFGNTRILYYEVDIDSVCPVPPEMYRKS